MSGYNPAALKLTTSGGRSMDSAGTAPTEISQGPLLSQPQRIINTFFDPVKTFTDLNRGTAWWMAFLLSVIISYGFVAAVATKVTFEQANENEMKLNPKQMEKMDQMPPDQRARAIGIGVTITKVISYAYPVAAFIGILLTALILMAAFNFGMGGNVGFGKAIAATVYAQLVLAIKGLLVAITLFAGVNPENFTFSNPLASNLGYFVDVNAHPALYRFGSSMDVFMIWYVILLGLGFSCISKVKRGTAIGVVVGLWLAWVLIATGIKAI
jgi:hypothetical protein